MQASSKVKYAVSSSSLHFRSDNISI